MDYIFSLDTPMARVFQKIHTDAFAAGEVSDAIDFILNWKKDNPELLIELRAFMDQAFEDYQEVKDAVNN